MRQKLKIKIQLKARLKMGTPIRYSRIVKKMIEGPKKESTDETTNTNT